MSLVSVKYWSSAFGASDLCFTKYLFESVYTDRSKFGPRSNVLAR